MLYEIINMSDPYTIACPDLEIAAVACVLLGEGQYGLTPVDQPDAGKLDRGVPLMLFGNAEEWFQEQFGASVGEVLGRVHRERREALATALDSTLIGTPQDRLTFFRLLEVVDVRERDGFRQTYHEGKLSSMNDIGGRAYAMAAKLRAGDPNLPKAPQQVFSG